MCVCLDNAEQKYFALHGPSMTHNTKFNTTWYEYQLEMRDLQNAPDFVEEVKKAFVEILNRTFKVGSNPAKDLVQVEIDNSGLDQAINIGFCPEEKMTAEKIMDTVEEVSERKNEVNLNENITVKITRIIFPKA